MSQGTKFKMSAAAARCIRKDASREEKLAVFDGTAGLVAADLPVVLFFLGHDPDAELRSLAISRLRAVPESDLLKIVGSIDAHPKLLHFFARIHLDNASLAEAIAVHPRCAEETLAFLAERGVAVAAGRLRSLANQMVSTGKTEVEEVPEDLPPAEDDEPVDEESEEFRSKYQLCQSMTISEKIKMAMLGDKEWRNILIKDPNKLVSGAVIKNPRITESEILTILKSSIQNDEIMRLICVNKEWVKNYQIRKALVENSKTPLQTALRFLSTLSDKDVSSLAKSKNISSVLATQARRIVMNKNKINR